MNEIIDIQRKALQREIENLGFEDLRYSLLLSENQSKEEWQWRIDFENGKYFVYGLADRASVMGKKRVFDDFQIAKKSFLERLKSVVDYNQWAVKNNMSTGYSSPLWDK